jgi:hypothetical protein
VLIAIGQVGVGVVEAQIWHCAHTRLVPEDGVVVPQGSSPVSAADAKVVTTTRTARNRCTAARDPMKILVLLRSTQLQ